MTLDEKAMMLDHSAPAIPRLKIPFWSGWNQCLHGIWSKTPTTEFPASIAAAATWDPDLVHEEGDALADEARALYNIRATGPQGPHGLVYRAPVINMSRDPRWGRIQECYGEDPYLTGRLAVAYVRGLQGDFDGAARPHLKIAATLKHFAVNNTETGRTTLSAQVPERCFYEYWLPQFKAGIVEGHAASIMAAYNAINGSPCAINHLLLDEVLRDQWHFDGFVVSDLGGIHKLLADRKLTKKPQEAVAWALLAGCDCDDAEFRTAISPAVKEGLVSEKVVDTALRRVLRTAFRLGVFDPPQSVPFNRLDASAIGSEGHRKLARRLAEESIVLLANQNGMLPLNAKSIKSVVVIGPAQNPEYGNYFGKSVERISPVDAVKAKLGGAVRIDSVKGCDFTAPALSAEIDSAAAVARADDLVLLFLGSNLKVEAEARDRTSLDLPGSQQQLLDAVLAANAKAVVILSSGGPLAAPSAKEKAGALLQMWYPGEEGGDALADILFGDASPAGRLPYTVYNSVQDVPPQSEYDVTKGFTYMYFRGKPLFPFGFGLSYTTFSYSNAHLSGESGQLIAHVDVQNTGKRDGDEVVQAYVHRVLPNVEMPQKKLAAFQRIHLAAGEKKTVTLSLSAEAFSYYDAAAHAFIDPSGPADVLIGSSSEDIRTTLRELRIVERVPAPIRLDAGGQAAK